MTKRQWIAKTLKENDFDKPKVYSLYEKCIAETGTTSDLDSFKRAVRLAYETMFGPDSTDYDDESYIRLEAQKQKLQDLNNVSRKTNRESFRIYNTIEEIYLEYVDLLKKVDLTKFKLKEHKPLLSDKIGVMQISDLHANELIFPNETNGNSYDFDIMSKRLKKYTTEAIQYFRYKKITEVHIFMTGDFINSSRRLGEKLSQCTSLVSSSLLTTVILKQMLIELNKYFDVTVSAVVGNESRLAEEWDATNIQLTENFDFLIFQQLQILFEGTPIKFNDIKNNSQYLVKMSNGFNALILHGNSFKAVGSVEKDVARILSQYIQTGNPIHGVFYGHYHSASLGDIVSRSSSLCGGNAYSVNDLGYASRASQNLYVMNPDQGYDAIKVDLQDVSDIQGYHIIPELERYNVRSSIANNRVTIENLI